MDGCQSTIPTSEGDLHVVAAAHHIVKALGATKNLSDDLRKILIDLDAHLSMITSNTDSKGGRGFLDVEERLKQAERKILSWESDPRMIWDSGPREASEYLEAVDEIQTLVDGLQGLSVHENRKQKELIHRAMSVLQMAMSRLEEELIHIVVQHRQQFDPKYMSSRSTQTYVVYDESFVSVEDEPAEETSSRNCSSDEIGEFIVDLIHADVIPDIKSIAKVMFTSNYGPEFCEAFIGVRKEALEQYFAILDTEKLSIEDVLKLEWTNMSSKMNKWTWSMKIIVRVYLASEKQLCDQVLGDFGSVSSFCFLEISKATILCLLNFGEAVAMGPHQPEKLLRLLDMYETLADLLRDIDTLFPEEAGSFVRLQFHELLESLGDSSIAAFEAFRVAISSNGSLYPFPGGGVHPLNKYVMNYIRMFPEYCNTLNLLLKSQHADVEDQVIEPDNGPNLSLSTSCPMACHLRSITSSLESNLHRKSQLYKNEALQHIFLMNNIHYMVQKVKGSELRLFFGDEWIRKHNGKFQQHAKNYERATWSSVIYFLKDDNPGSSSLSKSTFKERCKGFSIAFEEVYKTQTSWSIPDPQLREDLRISTSLKVVLAYRTFLGRNPAHIEDKCVKHTVEHVEKLLLDLFEGSPRSLRNSRRW
ncbi:Presenilin-2 [Hibiscus syriacus]|uniref:Exocyst subunit Exo70 family protein n=1 Tax=Hibiscus syriacus TaxID=106335 RepID=A0A6A2WRR0_HIBSY|nr:exocyst complex component EXO70E2-like [Hibiscus syriacus]KAE8658305.1 Presenilin-2 [Hibiscus syriacus]